MSLSLSLFIFFHLLLFVCWVLIFLAPAVLFLSLCRSPSALLAAADLALVAAAHQLVVCRTHMRAHTHTRTHKRTHTHAHTHTHTHAHTHMHA